MHPLGENGAGSGVPAFLAKLWRMLDTPNEHENLISWSSDGRSFIIQNQARFAKELLPLNYKHNNMASFIRQLNMYGFHKITSIDNGGLKFDRDEMEFSHPYFQKGHPYLLEHIKRKIANPKQGEDKTPPKTEAMNRVLTEVKTMRGRQESLDTRFSAMKQENEALWREVAILRQKHMKQQQIVNKLIQFLVTLVQPNRTGLGGMGGKRRFQLMINDAPQSSKVRRISDLLEHYMVKKSDDGPIIHELTEELLDEVESDVDPDDIEIPSVQSPASETSQSPVHPDQIDFESGASGGLNYDEIDEIDTDNMAIYNDEDEINRELAPLIKQEIIKQENLKRPVIIEQKKKNQKRDATVLSKLKQEPKELEDLLILSNAKKAKKQQSSPPSPPVNSSNGDSNKGKSLLINSNSNQNKTSIAGKNLPEMLNYVQNNGKKQSDSDLISNFLIANSPQAMASNSNSNVLDVQQPSTSTSTGKDINNGKNLMYTKNDYIVPDAMPQAIFDENSQNAAPIVSDDIQLFDGGFSPNLMLNNYDDSGRQTDTPKSDSSLCLTKYNPQNSNDILKLHTANDYSQHLDNVQLDLDSLKDLLGSEHYQMDAKSIMGLKDHQAPSPNYGRIYFPQQGFGVDTINKSMTAEKHLSMLFGDDDVLPYELTQGSAEMFHDKKSTDDSANGSQLMQYQHQHQHQPTLSTPTNDLSELEMLEMLTQ